MKRIIVAAVACVASSGAFAAEAPACKGMRDQFKVALAEFADAEARVNQMRQAPTMPPQEIRRSATDDAIRRSGRVLDLASAMQKGQCLGFNGKPGDWASVQRTTTEQIAAFGRFGAEPDSPRMAARPPAPQPKSSWSFLPSALSSSAPAPAPEEQAVVAAPQPVQLAEQTPQAPVAASSDRCVGLREEQAAGGLDQYIVNNCDYAVNVKVCFAWKENKKGNQFQCGTKGVYATKKPIEPGFQRKMASTRDPFRWFLNRCNASENPTCVPRTPFM